MLIFYAKTIYYLLNGSLLKASKSNDLQENKIEAKTQIDTQSLDIPSPRIFLKRTEKRNNSYLNQIKEEVENPVLVIQSNTSIGSIIPDEIESPGTKETNKINSPVASVRYFESRTSSRTLSLGPQSTSRILNFEQCLKTEQLTTTNDN